MTHFFLGSIDVDGLRRDCSSVFSWLLFSVLVIAANGYNFFKLAICEQLHNFTRGSGMGNQ